MYPKIIYQQPYLNFCLLSLFQRIVEKLNVFANVHSYVLLVVGLLVCFVVFLLLKTEAVFFASHKQTESLIYVKYR